MAATTSRAARRASRLALALVVVAVSALDGCAGYPYLVGRSKCGDDAHPTRGEGDHPSIDPSGASTISVENYWSSYDGSSETQAWERWENATKRLMPASWDVGETYKPSGRFTLLVDLTEVVREESGWMVLVTCSDGVFEDIDMHEEHIEGNGGSASALRCDGKRLNPSLRTNKHKLIWRAPSGLSDVKIRVTAAAHSNGRFYQKSVVLRADATLQTPLERNSTHEEPSHDEETLVSDSKKVPSVEAQNLAFAVHGAMMFAGIWMLMPAAVGWSRFGRPGPNDKPSATWLAWHKWLMTGAVVAVVIAALVAYVEISKTGGEHYDCPHSQLGLFLVVVIASQPLGGVLRPATPPAGGVKSTARRTWEIAHKGLGYIILLLGCVAVLTGIDELAERGGDDAAFFHASLFVVYASVAVAVFFHLTRHHRARTNHTARTAFIELSSVDHDDDVESDAAPLRAVHKHPIPS